MRDELEMQLQNDFPFMWQKHEKGQNLYRRWGCECSGGWYGIIHDACQAIADAYAEAGISVDFVPAQIKEKFGTLRFYYGYEDAPYGMYDISTIFLRNTRMSLNRREYYGKS